MTSYHTNNNHQDDIIAPTHQLSTTFSSDLKHDDIVHADNKAEVEHYDAEHAEGKGDEVADAWSKGQVATGYENVSIPGTIKKFKMACLVCLLATFAASTDGYQSE